MIGSTNVQPMEIRHNDIIPDLTDAVSTDKANEQASLIVECDVQCGGLADLP